MLQVPDKVVIGFFTAVVLALVTAIGILWAAIDVRADIQTLKEQVALLTAKK